MSLVKIVFWFRRDLRLYDNAGLYAALSTKESEVIPVFIFDPNDPIDPFGGINGRNAFKYVVLRDMKDELEKTGRDIRVMIGDPQTLLPGLCSEVNAKYLFTNEEYFPPVAARDAVLKKKLEEQNVEMKMFRDAFVRGPLDVLNQQGEPFKVFTPYSRAWNATLPKDSLDEKPSQKCLNRIGMSECSSMPSLKELGLEEPLPAIPPIVRDMTRMKNYEHTRNFLHLTEGTTRWSVHLRMGTLGIREAFRLAKGNSSLHNELIWREFYMMIMVNFPHVVDGNFKPQYDAVQWNDNMKQLKAWQNGQTGFPIVDAGMRELNTTGYMHNRSRMITASFLTKLLLLDWRLGEKYFADRLMDYEPSSNNGGWQWSASTGTDSQPYFRIFNPDLQAKRWDPEGTYVKKFCPEKGTLKYPKPMIDYEKARSVCLLRFKHALS